LLGSQAQPSGQFPPAMQASASSQAWRVGLANN